MADNTEVLRNGITYEPQAADPSNPVEGDVFMSNGTPRAIGLWIYKSAAWEAIASGAIGNLTVTTKTLDYTATASDDVILMNNTVSKTLTLPTAVGNEGKTFYVVKIDGTSGISVTIEADGSETIDGELNIDLDRQYQSVRIVSDNANWFVISGRHQLDSMVRLHQGNGHGSSSTKIRRFTNADKNVGSAITYVDSSTLGATFTINEIGIYSITYCEVATSDSQVFGISLNSAQLTTSIQSIIDATNLATADIGTVSIQARACVSWTGILDQDDVIRPHTEGTGLGTSGKETFCIVKIGRL